MKRVEHVGFLGLGQMGGAMAERLLGQAYCLHVFDPAPEAPGRFTAGGAVAHASPRAVADAASIVFACLPGNDISLATAFGPDGVIHGSAIRIYAEMSTIGKDTIEQLANALQAKGIETLDAPVTGGPPAARAGTLAMLVSGAPAALDVARPLLARMGKDIYPMGDRPGMAQIMKIVNNLIMAANTIVSAEGLVMGAKAGLDAEMMMRVLKAGSGQSFAGSEVLGRAVSGRFDFGAALSILDKDVNLGLREAALLNVDMPVIDQARQVWHAAYQAGWGTEDFSAILKVIEEKSSTLVRAASLLQPSAAA